MAKTLEEKIDKVLIDFADLDILYINRALKMNKVSPIDFYTFLDNNEKYLKRYNQIDHYNNMFKEDMIAEKAYREANTSDKGVLAMLMKANNKAKFDSKAEINHNLNFSSKSDDDLTNEIMELLNKSEK